MARSDDYYKRLEEEEKKVRDIGGFNYSRQADYDAAWQRLNNREPFKYDLNKDALYKQYKDQYAALGKLAMQDTIGQASAMTGGYGNSYALTAGQQMYNQYMQKPNEMIPTLYGMARDRYDAEGNDLRNQFNLLAADRDYQYGLYNDAYQKALAERDYANTQFNNERSFELQQAAAARARSGGGGGGNNPKPKAISADMKKEAWNYWSRNGDSGLDEYQALYGLSDDDMLSIYEFIDARRQNYKPIANDEKRSGRSTK